MLGVLVKIKGGYELNVIKLDPRCSDRMVISQAYLNAQKINFKGKKEVKDYCASNNITPHNFY